MTLLDPSELAEVRAYAESGMTSTAMILRRTTIQTDNGLESVWATVGDEVPCWVKEITAASTELGAVSGAVAVTETFSVRLPVGTEVYSGDELGVGSTIYSVQHVNDEDTYGVWLNCACRVVD